MAILKNLRFYTVIGGVSLAQFVVGMFLGWTSPMIPKLLDEESTSKVTADEALWAVSLLKLGTAFGCFLSIFMVDFMGRKHAMLVTVVPTLVGWSLAAWGTSILNLYVARFVGGISSGIIFTSGSMYVTEISPPTIRGALCSYIVLMNYCGSLLGHAIGPMVTVQEYSYVAMSLTVLQFLMVVWCPETPYQLLRRKHHGAAMDSLMLFRGSADVTEEMDSIMRAVEAGPKKNRLLSPILHLLAQPGGKQAILIGMGIMTIQAFSGSIILILQAKTIFQKIHNLQVQETYMSIMLATVHIISCVMCICQVDRTGRKPLMIMSTIGVVTCTFILGVYFCMQENDLNVTNLQWLAFVAILFYNASVSLGFSSVPFTVTKEIFPIYAKASCVSVCFALNYVWSFVMVLIWRTVAFEHNMFVVFWFISSLNAFSILFLVFYIPETKRLLLIQIQEKFICRLKK